MCACRADPALLLAATSGLLLAGLTDELAGLLRRDAPVGVVFADAHGRGQRAGAYAVHRLQSEEHVGGGVADGDVKLLGERLGHQRRAGHVAGAPLVAEAFAQELDIAVGDTTPDMLFTLQTVNCIGACALAPAVRIGEDDTYGRVTPQQARKLVRQTRKKEA